MLSYEQFKFELVQKIFNVQPTGTTEFSGYRTIMAYSAPNHWLRVNHYSSKDVSYNGNPTGNWKTNNAKVIFNNRFAMAASGGEENNCTLTSESSFKKSIINFIL